MVSLPGASQDLTEFAECFLLAHGAKDARKVLAGMVSVLAPSITEELQPSDWHFKACATEASDELRATSLELRAGGSRAQFNAVQ